MTTPVTPFKTEQERLAWCMFYSSIIGWQFHPGNARKLNSMDAALLADQMLMAYRHRSNFLEK